MYTIGEVAEMFQLTISTLRYYDKEGLLLEVKRDENGIRKFTETNLEALRVIECLKKSGMQIKDIKTFMKWCALGDQTIPQRLKMFEQQKENILKKIEELQKALNMIYFKCWYYEEASKKGTAHLQNLDITKLPKEIQHYYQKSHE